MRLSGAFCAAAVVLATMVGCARSSSESTDTLPRTTNEVSPSRELRPERLPTRHLPNAFRIHARVISGGQPEGAAAFDELRRLGIRTIISVDGAPPQVELARQHGLRYVHLPHGYDGISAEHSRLLAKAVRDLPGPVYIHCHHGKHRSPAAAAVACVGAGLLPADAALTILRTAGTSESYRGLYQTAQEARRFERQVLDQLDADFPETSRIPPMALAMVEMEKTFDRLRQLASHDWSGVPDHPDLVANHEALLLREHFAELARTQEVQRQPDGFQRLMIESQEAAHALEAAFPPPATESPEFRTQATEALRRIGHLCTTCHASYRDVPLQEKTPR